MCVIRSCSMMDDGYVYTSAGLKYHFLQALRVLSLHDGANRSVADRRGAGFTNLPLSVSASLWGERRQAVSGAEASALHHNKGNLSASTSNSGFCGPKVIFTKPRR